MTLLRRVLPLSLVAALATASVAPAPLVAQDENVRYAAIVVEAETGEVLFARHADARRYPASITKVMTLYMVFEALQEGRVKLTDEIVVSPRAASQPPSKLGLAAGQTITVDDAMRSLAVRSANDMAVALAEHVGGSEARFCADMTLKAQQLGMNSTRFVNANGLPDSRQLTTARDLAILTRAVMRDFPQYYSYFGQQHWYYNGREYSNTNGLLHRGDGYDGIKTGYTNASGYNLAASAVRNGKRINTIVLGGRSTASRNAHVAELMNTGFEVERLRGQGQPLRIAQNFFEQRGFGIGPNPGLAGDGPVSYAALNRTPPEAEVARAANAVSYASRPAQPIETAAVTPPPSAARGAAGGGQPRTLTDLLNAGVSGESALASGDASATEGPASGRWTVQVGAFKDREVAQGWLTEVDRRFRAQFRGADRTVQQAGDWYRSRFTGFTQDAAEAACAALAERRVTCAVVRPD